MILKSYLIYISPTTTPKSTMVYTASREANTEQIRDGNGLFVPQIYYLSVVLG